MSKWAKWTEDELMRLGFLIQAGFTNPEIAEQLGKPKTGVQIKANRLWGGNPNYRIQKTKHKHLRLPVMQYFMRHSAAETIKQFDLSESEFKSIMTVGYMDKQFSHLRKDKRQHAPWTTKQLVFLLRHSGLRPRKWVAEQIGRGNAVCIKERLQALGLSSRTLQGITLSQFRQAFGADPEFFLQTDAGPDGGSRGGFPTRWKIIPWVWLDQEMKTKRLKAPKMFRQLIATRAIFQEWIFKGNALPKMKRIIRECEL